MEIVHSLGLFYEGKLKKKLATGKSDGSEIINVNLSTSLSFLFVLLNFAVVSICVVQLSAVYLTYT